MRTSWSLRICAVWSYQSVISARFLSCATDIQMSRWLGHAYAKVQDFMTLQVSLDWLKRWFKRGSSWLPKQTALVHEELRVQTCPRAGPSHRVRKGHTVIQSECCASSSTKTARQQDSMQHHFLNAFARRDHKMKFSWQVRTFQFWNFFRTYLKQVVGKTREKWGQLRGWYRDSLLETAQEAVTIAATRVHRWAQ